MEMVYGWAPITKVEDQPDGTVIVHGPMTNTALDRDKQRFNQGWLDNAVPRWFNESGNIREQHDGKKAAGAAMHITRSDSGGWELTSHVVDPVAVLKVKNKVYKGYSIGVKDPHVTYGKADAPGGEIDGGYICETSLVDRPSNPTTLFTMVKADIPDQPYYVNEVVEKVQDASGRQHVDSGPQGGQFAPKNSEPLEQGHTMPGHGTHPMKAPGGGGKGGHKAAKKAVKKPPKPKAPPKPKKEPATKKPKETKEPAQTPPARTVDGQAVMPNQADSTPKKALPAPATKVDEPDLAKGWDPSLHPRGHDGKFIGVASEAGRALADSGKTVVGLDRQGRQITGQAFHHAGEIHVASHAKFGDVRQVTHIREATEHDFPKNMPKVGEKVMVPPVFGKGPAEEMTVTGRDWGPHGARVTVHNANGGGQTVHYGYVRRIGATPKGTGSQGGAARRAARRSTGGHDTQMLKTDIAHLLKFVSAKQRDKYADSGVAMPNGDFPIADKDHLSAALGRYSHYTGDKSAAKAHIKKRAAALGVELDEESFGKVDKGDEPVDTTLADLEGLAEDTGAWYLLAALAEKSDDSEDGEDGNDEEPPAKPAKVKKSDLAEAVEAGLSKMDLAGTIAAAVTEAMGGHRETIESLKADLAKVLAQPEPGGPVQVRTAAQAQSARNTEVARIQSQYADLMAKADDARRSDPTLAAGYLEQARRLQTALTGANN